MRSVPETLQKFRFLGPHFRLEVIGKTSLYLPLLPNVLHKNDFENNFENNLPSPT